MKRAIHTLFRPIQANGRVVSNSYIEASPSLLLAPYVACYWLSEPAPAPSEAAASPAPHARGSAAIDRVLPDGCHDILFEQDIARDQYRIRFCGFFDEPFVIAYDKAKPVRKFGVRFFPGAAHSLLGIPLQELANAHYDIDVIWPGMAERIGQAIFEAPSFEIKIRIMERFLLSNIRNRTSKNENLIRNLLYRIFETEGESSVQELAAREAVSSRQMNRVFGEWIGASPKRFCKIVRFQAIVGDMKRKHKIDGASLALQHGYYDQAHMIRDFKRFYGDSPYVAAREFGSMSDLYNRAPERF